MRIEIAMDRTAMKRIAVCICTFKRPGLLRRLLTSLKEQDTEGQFDLSIAVVDNDRAGSAAATVAEFKKDGPMPILYAVEPEQNISLARNRALTSVEADFFACLDDDEIAAKDWLLRLYRTIIQYGADGVLGPVRPTYDEPPPRWLVKGRIQERKEFPTGTVLADPKYCRTGNVLFSKDVLAAQDRLFDPSYGRTGGEDIEFFRRAIGLGRKFVWCNEAVAWEVTPPFRQKRSYYLRRALLRGVVQSDRAALVSLDSLKSVAACLVYALALPVVFVVRNRLFMPILIRVMDHAGKLLARCGITPVKGRNEA